MSNLESNNFDTTLRRLANNDPSLTVLKLMYGFSLRNDEETGRLASALTTNTTVTELFLPSNNIGPEGARVLARAIQQNRKTIVRVYLTRNRIGNDGTRFLAASLAHCSLKELYLAGNGIGHVGVEHLATALVDNTSLKKLDLRDNHIDNLQGMEAIRKILSSNLGLEWLYLWGNRAISSDNTEHHQELMNGIRERCRRQVANKKNTLLGVCVGHPQLQRQINDYIEWNRLGRRLLSSETNETMPTVLWTHYLAKIGSECDLIYDMVRAKPDLFKRNGIGQKRPLLLENDSTEEEKLGQANRCSKRHCIR